VCISDFVSTAKAINEYIIKTTGFSPVFCVENVKCDNVYSDDPEAKNSIYFNVNK
jgi:hypothetical protein